MDEKKIEEMSQELERLKNSDLTIRRGTLYEINELVTKFSGTLTSSLVSIMQNDSELCSKNILLSTRELGMILDGVETIASANDLNFCEIPLYMVQEVIGIFIKILSIGEIDGRSILEMTSEDIESSLKPLKEGESLYNSERVEFKPQK